MLNGKYIALLMLMTAFSYGCAGGRLSSGEDMSAVNAQHNDNMLFVRQWSELFNSQEIDALINTALNESPTLSAAEAALREAHENLNARVGANSYPTVDAALSATRQKTNPAAAGLPDGKGSIFDLKNASVVVSYKFDLFGGSRHEINVLKSQVDFQQYQLKGAYLALTGNIVTTAIREAGLREQLSALQEIVSLQEKQLDLLEKQMQMGAAARADVLAQRALVESTRAQVPLLEKELALIGNQLTVLLGKIPQQVGPLPKLELNMTLLSRAIPSELEAEAVRQRPDVKAAEALVRAAGAGVGVATANLYPQINLTSGYGLQAGHLSNMLDANSVVWNVGAGLLQPVFNGGALQARRRAAVAVYDQASAHFRQTVLAAFQNVTDALRALEADDAALQAQGAALNAAKDSMELAQKQFVIGAVNYMVLLNAQRQYQQAVMAQVQAKAARMADQAALFQALGGAWWK